MSIHTLSATELVRHLESGELSSVEIVDALIERRRAVDPAVNAFTQINEQARGEARAADEARARGEARSPLHGLPITIKDNLDFAGLDSTLGLRSRAQRPASEDAVLVAELRRLGAVVLGKTNVPQLLLAQETENDVYGVTRNPWNLERVPGGSSGGEGAALATGMSPLGIGTDIGGSIRIPAHFCGVAGLKPTVDRWSNRGSQTAVPGQELVRAQIGPMARTVADLELLWTCVSTLTQASADPQVPPLAPGDPAAIDLSGMRIGVYDTDDLIEPVPALRRAVHRAAEILADAGAVIVDYEPTPSADIIYMWMAALTSDGGATIDRSLAGEPPSPQLKPSRMIARVPGPARRLASSALARLGEHRVARLLDVLGRKPVEELWQLTNERTLLRRRESDAWQRTEIDALICPAHVAPAMRHRESSDFTLSIGPCARWSLLNFPAGIVPITKVRSGETDYPRQSDRLDAKVRRVSEGSEGLPVGVQVVTRPYREDLALAVMRHLEIGVRSDAELPRAPIDPQ